MRINKLFFAVLLMVITVVLSSCADYSNDDENTQITTADVSNDIVETLKPAADVEAGDEYDSPYDDYKYRAIYYSISAPFVDLVDEDVYWNWLKNETPYKKYPLDNVEEMAIVAFIKKFNISREDFDKANEKYRQILLNYGGVAVVNPAEDNPFYDRNIECSEIYNADIIYTFDNEIINSYYLYVDPYEKELQSEQNQ